MNMGGEIEIKGLYNKVYNIINAELSKKKPNTEYIKQLESKLTREEFILKI
jgi:hypothetical protein